MLQVKSIINRRSLAVSVGLLAVLLVALTISAPGVAAAMTAQGQGHGQADFGPNVIVFDPSMPQADIQAKVDEIVQQMEYNQFGPERYAIFFKPGAYNVDARVGYYTSVAGLGLLPDDVAITGAVRVEAQNLPASSGPDCDWTSLINFWRSIENLSINPIDPPWGNSAWERWAVSQAAPMRRVHIRDGGLTLFPAGCGYSSGGFIADTQVNDSYIDAEGKIQYHGVINGSQQQWMTRNSEIGWWSNGVWNQVFSGVVGAPATSFGLIGDHDNNPDTPPQLLNPYTTLDTSPVTREKPFLYIDESGEYAVFVPALRRDSVGTSWSNGPAEGYSIPIRDFFVAKPGDKVSKINAALARGQNLLLTPGIYHLDKTIQVKRPNTVVLGLGYATLIPENGIMALSVADVPGVKIASVLIDAGPVNSPVLMEVGKKHGHRPSDPNNPISLHDVFFRIGGAGPGKATVSLVVNSDNTILDHLWAWRADHGEGVGWDVNTADTGVIVNGDNVIAYGLFVEHYQKYQVIWNGENGRTIMFQNEMPYDPPSQAAWQHDGILGYAAYKVADSVQTHEAWGLGSYCYFNQEVDIHATSGFEVPVTAGVKLHSILTVYLAGSGGIDHTVNDTGAPVFDYEHMVTNLISYP